MTKPFIKSKTFKVLIIILALAAAVAAVLSVLHAQNKKKVIQLAKDYLEETYEEQMEFQRIIFFYPATGPTYRVVFSPADQPHFTFWVDIYGISGFSKDVSPSLMKDNYVKRRYEYLKREAMLPKVRSVFGEDVEFWVMLELRGKSLAEDITIEELEEYVNNSNAYFTYGISTKGSLPYESAIDGLAEKLYPYIEWIKEQNCLPLDIGFYYEYRKRKMYVTLKVSEIQSLEQLIEIMNTEAIKSSYN